MPVPFRDAADIEELGLAGFLVVRPAPAGPDFVGALFVINARGEPQEFTYSRVTLPHPMLWREQDIRRYVERSLVSALLDACPPEPLVLLARAGDIHPDLFRKDLLAGVPVVRIAPKQLRAAPEEVAAAEGAARLELAWYPAAPVAGTAERRLVDELTARGLLIEPFERAERGLDEVYDPESWSSAERPLPSRARKRP
jgi:hypothetical protein